MDKRILQTYSTWAKENLENQIEVSLKALGINDEKDIKPAKQVGDVTTIEGDPKSYPSDLYGKRESIIGLVTRNGYRNVIEEFAYTWFNRFVALKFMEVHGFLSHGFRVLSDPAGGIEPEILKNLNLVSDELHLDMSLCSEYKQQGKIEELFRHVLIKQCNELSRILPMLFSADLGYLELLLPVNLLKGETVITRLNEIPEEAFMDEVEIIGWMYQFYISAKKDAVYASKKTITKDTLPAVTQLFTPDWIVRYMAENSVGRLWLESYPDSAIRSEMKYYVEDAEQTPEVQKKIDEIKYKNVNPEEIRIIEPCCGSGHILVYVFDLLYKMYEERGYQKRDIPTLILKNNLVGLDVDKRASQLASFSLIMKARSVNNRFFNDQYYEAPHVYELRDSKVLNKLNYQYHLKNLNILTDEEISLFTYLADTFENGKTIGSLLKVKPIDFTCLDAAFEKISNEAVSDFDNVDFMSTGIKRFKELANLAKVLSAKYDVMITNPPYRPISTMEGAVIDYAADYYPNSKSDMFAMFMETSFTKINGFLAMINMQSWMSLATFKDLRKDLVFNYSVVTMIHLGARAFDSIGGEVVKTTSFVIRNSGLVNYSGTYYSLVDGKSEEEKRIFFFENKHKYITNQESFKRIDGVPYTAYWLSDSGFDAFSTNKAIKDGIAQTFRGLQPGGLNYVKNWFEVSSDRIKWMNSKKENIWYPMSSGGELRKWYGNLEKVVLWANNGAKIKSNGKAIIPNENLYFKAVIGWSRISSGTLCIRYYDEGLIPGDATGCIYADNSTMIYLLGALNSKAIKELWPILNSNMTNSTGIVSKIPIVYPKENHKSTMDAINNIVCDCIQLSRDDWNSFEVSWDFEEHPFLKWSKNLWDATAIGATIQHYYGCQPEVGSPLELCFMLWQGECNERFSKLKSNEEELNRIFIDIYGLQDELTPEVVDDAVTVRPADKEREVRSFISYLVGVAMGRYSLDAPGLAYAGGDWDASKYISYQPDDDGIIPIYNGIGMEDGLTTVLIKLIKQIYGEDTYRENIDFIAEALGKKNNESSEETLNRYLNDKNGFYKNHLTIYQKKPIYWLFSSGDNSGFKCLVYMHRYNEDTLARINAKYFLPESTRKKNELDELNSKIAHAEGREKLRFEKERQNLAAAYNEAIEYGQVLDHMANQYISIDLDDGVKVNYAKFQGVEIVTDGGSKVKKDLLYPL